VRDRWQVYPTNRANPDTIRLSLAELRRLGELESREHLSAGHAIDASEDAETDQQ
jgi:hypothetical protein